MHRKVGLCQLQLAPAITSHKDVLSVENLSPKSWFYCLPVKYNWKLFGDFRQWTRTQFKCLPHEALKKIEWSEMILTLFQSYNLDSWAVWIHEKKCYFTEAVWRKLELCEILHLSRIFSFPRNSLWNAVLSSESQNIELVYCGLVVSQHCFKQQLTTLSMNSCLKVL